MSRSLVVLAAVAAGVLGLTASAGAQVSVPAPAPTALTAPSLMPEALSPAFPLFGVRSVPVIPSGSTVLVWSLNLVEGQTIDLTMTCPAGTAIADTGADDPGGSTAVPGAGFSFEAWYGTNSQTISFPTQKPGVMDWYILCMPSATATTTRFPGKTSPVTFPGEFATPTVARGARLPKGSVVLVSKTSTLTANATIVRMSRPCPAGTYAFAPVPASPGRGGNGAMSQAFTLFASPGMSGRSVTAYVLCAPLSPTGTPD